MNATSDGAALLAAIAQFPDEQTPREMHLDWCEDHDPPRAEFIRVQRELESIDEPVIHRLFSKTGPVPDPMVKRHAELKTRESELLAAHSKRWLRGPACGKCGGTGYTGKRQHASECFTCHGTGDSGGLTWPAHRTDFRALREMREPAPVRFRDGLPTWVKCSRLTDVIGQRPQDPRLGLNAWMEYATPPPISFPTPWLAAVVKHHPVAQVAPADRYPENVGYGWCWRYEGLENGRENVPRELYTGDVQLVHATPREAQEALAARIVVFARAA